MLTQKYGKPTKGKSQRERDKTKTDRSEKAGHHNKTSAARSAHRKTRTDAKNLKSKTRHRGGGGGGTNHSLKKRKKKNLLWNSLFTAHSIIYILNLTSLSPGSTVTLPILTSSAQGLSSPLQISCRTKKYMQRAGTSSPSSPVWASVNTFTAPK